MDLDIVIENLLRQIKKIKQGFTRIINAGNNLLSISDICYLHIAYGFLTYESDQLRMFGVYLLGELSAKEKKAVKIVETKVVKDGTWRDRRYSQKLSNTIVKKEAVSSPCPRLRNGCLVATAI